MGPCPEGMECCHLDGNRENNHVSNLKWGTPCENNSHKKHHGTETIGEFNPMAKLDNEKVKAIRSAKGTYAEMSETFGVPISTLAKVRNRVTWKHI